MIERHELYVAPLKDARPNLLLNTPKHIAITEDTLGVASQLKKALTAKGHRVDIVTELPAVCDAAILLNGLTTFDSIDAALQCQKNVFNNVKRIADHFQKNGGMLVILQNTGGQFGFSAMPQTNAWSGGLAGLVKTAQHEWPDAICKAIDIDTNAFTIDEMAQAILEELAIKRTSVECGLSKKTSPITLDTQLISVTASTTPRVNNDDVFVVTGGARGVTAACLIELAKTHQPCFAIFGRTPLFDEPLASRSLKDAAQLKQLIFAESSANNTRLTPKDVQQQVSRILANREVAATLKALNDAGSEVAYFPVDVLNEDALRKGLEAVRARFHTITGIVHGAGVLADKLISQKTFEQFNLVFDTKVLGLKNLLTLTEKDPLRFIVFFSSVAGRYGNIGQCDYAMANETLNKIAQFEQQKRGNQTLVKSLNWGPWDSGMVTPELKAAFARRGVATLSVEAGIKSFVAELNDANFSAVEVVLGGRLENVVPENITPKNITKSSQQYHVTLNAKTHPYILSHVVNGTVVLPACLALEWFVQAANTFFPDLKQVKIKKFKVLRGVTLPDFLKRDYTFTIQPTQIQSATGKATFTLQLIGEAEKLHYSAEVELSSHYEAAEIFSHNIANKKAWTYSIEDVYANPYLHGNERRLFHGPDFHAITELTQVDDQSGEALLSGLQQKNWQGNFKTDVLLFDGVLQLALLWNFQMLGRQTLPTAIGEVIIHETTIPKHPLRCLFQSHIKNLQQTVFDASLVHPDGTVYATFRQIEISAINPS